VFIWLQVTLSELLEMISSTQIMDYVGWFAYVCLVKALSIMNVYILISI